MRRYTFLLVFVAACGGRPAGTRLSSEATAADPKLEECDFTASDGQPKAQCGTLVVPEMRGGTDATIRLPMTRIKALSGTSLTPIVYIGDGPGASAYQVRPPVALLENHDFVIVGARGIDGQRTLECPEVGKALATGAALTPEWLSAVAAEFDHCMNRFVGDGVQLAGYSVHERAADIERAREVLGYPKVSVLADGFGATVAEEYARSFSDHVERMVFLGPSPSKAPIASRENATWALREFASECSAIAECDERGSNFEQLVRETQLPERWMMYRIDAGRLRLATSLHLSYRRSAFLELGAWQDAARGDAAGLGQVSWGTNVIFTSGFIWGAGLLELASLQVPAEPLVDDAPRSLTSATTIAALTGLGLSSSHLPQFAPLGDASVSADTLVIYGALDPRYPPRVIQDAMARELSNVRFAQALGHASPSELWGTAPDLLGRTVLQFVEGKPVPTDLAPTPMPPGGLRLATTAKLVIVGMACFPVLAALLVWFLLRRLKKAMKRDLATAAQRPA